MISNMKWLQETLVGLIRSFGTILAWCAVGAFVTVTAISILWKLDESPIRGLDAAAAQLPSRFFADMLSLEITNMSAIRGETSFSGKNVTSFLTRLTTGIDPADPRTLTAQILPGSGGDMGFFIIRGVGTHPSDMPLEVPPAPHLRQIGEEAPVPPIPPLPPDEADEADEPAAPPNVPDDEPNNEAPPAGDDPDTMRVLIYHSHPTEAFLPYLEGVTEMNEAYSNDSEATVSAVGAHLAESLRGLGIGALHSDVYYPWDTAYQESRKTVKAAMQEHEDLQFFIDIHRDSAPREVTVLEHEGQTYAKLLFVIGQKNPNYEKNQAFAKEIHDRIEEKVLGLSRGIFMKKAGSNGEFNQSLSPNSVVVEIGGVENTMEENKRTAELLAEVLAEMYWEQSEAVRANADL